MKCLSSALRWNTACRAAVRHPRRPYATSTSASGLPGDIYDVVCVGGGPAGLSLVAALRSSPATSGLKIALIEGQDLKKSVLQNATPSIFSNRCSSLTPASVRFLKEIGAWAFIDSSRVQPYHGMQVWDGLTNSRISFDWSQTSSINYPSTPHPPSQTIAYMIENINLTTGLQNYINHLGGVEILSPARVDTISHGPTSEEVDLSTWPTVALSTGRNLTARLLVGADGANSPVRTFAGIQSRGWDYRRMGVVATLRLDAAPEEKIAYQRFLPTGPIAMLPLPGNMASLVWSTTPERAKVLKSLDPEDFTAMVNAGFRLGSVDLEYLHSMQNGQKDEITWRMGQVAVEAVVPRPVSQVQEGTVAAFPLKMRHVDAYASERIALVGDAAHTIHPLAGQGLNQGQGDVASLAKVIETAMESGQDIGAFLSLEAYNAERYAANNLLLGVCDKLHKLYSVESGPVVPLRSWGLKAVDSLGFLKGLLMRTAAGGA